MAQGAVHEKLWTPANVVTLLRICLQPAVDEPGGDVDRSCLVLGRHRIVMRVLIGAVLAMVRLYLLGFTVDSFVMAVTLVIVSLVLC